VLAESSWKRVDEIDSLKNEDGTLNLFHEEIEPDDI
jgi:hypothetical protein